MILKFLELFTAKKSRKGIVFVKKIDDHKFYQFESIDELPVRRYAKYLELLRSIDKFKLSHEQAIYQVEQVIKALDDKNISIASKYINALHAYMTLDHNTDIVFEICNLFVLINDEPANEMSRKHSLLKKKIYAEKGELFVFFCDLYSVSILKQTSTSSGSSLAEFLKGREVSVIEQMKANLSSSTLEG